MTHEALLVIDVQNIYADPDSPLFIASLKESVERINALSAAFAKAGKPVIYVRHVHRADGRDAGRMFDFGGVAAPISFVEELPESAFVPALKIVAMGLHMTKHRYSCFEGTELDAILRMAGVNTVVICGYMTNFCCETTARVAHDRDYFVDFVADATGAPGLSESFGEKEIIQAVTATLAAGFARVVATDEVLRRMT